MYNQYSNQNQFSTQNHFQNNQQNYPQAPQYGDVMQQQKQMMQMNQFQNTPVQDNSYNPYLQQQFMQQQQQQNQLQQTPQQHQIQNQMQQNIIPQHQEQLNQQFTNLKMGSQDLFQQYPQSNQARRSGRLQQKRITGDENQMVVNEEKQPPKRNYRNSHSQSDDIKQLIWIKENEVDQQIVCDVCLDDTVDESDQGVETDGLVICDNCNVAVHQSCYGRELQASVPNEGWFCNRCQNLFRYNVQAMKCELCPDLKGAIVQVQTGKWYHICCINWHNNVWFQEISAPNSIGTTELVKDTRLMEGRVQQDSFELFCIYCKDRSKNRGACIQCDFKDCLISFHVRCAMKHGNIKDWHSMNEQRITGDEYESYVFCKKHEVTGYDILRQFGPQGLQASQINTTTPQKKRVANKKGKNLKVTTEEMDSEFMQPTFDQAMQSVDEDEFEETNYRTPQKAKKNKFSSPAKLMANAKQMQYNMQSLQSQILSGKMKKNSIGINLSQQQQSIMQYTTQKPNYQELDEILQKQAARPPSQFNYTQPQQFIKQQQDQNMQQQQAYYMQPESMIQEQENDQKQNLRARKMPKGQTPVAPSPAKPNNFPNSQWQHDQELIPVNGQSQMTVPQQEFNPHAQNFNMPQMHNQIVQQQQYNPVNAPNYMPHQQQNQAVQQQNLYYQMPQQQQQQMSMHNQYQLPIAQTAPFQSPHFQQQQVIMPPHSNKSGNKNEAMFQVDINYAKHIGLQVPVKPMSRKDLQSSFIQFAIEKGLVNQETMKEYNLANDKQLMYLMGVEKFPAKDIFKTLTNAGLIKQI